MKNLKILFCLILIAGVFSCDSEDANVYNKYDNINGQTGVGFTASSKSAVVPVNGQIDLDIQVQVTTISTNERTYSVIVDNEATVANSQDYSVGSVTIPANSYFGTLGVTLYDNTLVDLEAYSLVLNLDLPEGVSVVGSESVTVNFNRYLVCNDLTLVITEDAYADERNWQITDSNGLIVVECADYSNCPSGAPSGSIPAQTYTYNFNLPDGCYTFTITDSYGDGQFDGNTTGNYSLDCSIINHAYGEGNWGSSQSTDFCVNP